MLSIGDFARLGRVSVRMLRHYDAIGVLRPAHVDKFSGYRSYDAHQLQRLNRMIALKELGFTLEQTRSVLDEQVTIDQLRGMLRLRQAEVQEQLAEQAGRLHRIQARLRLIESENEMDTQDVIVKKVPAVRVAELTATAASFGPEHIGPVIQPMYPELCKRLDEAGVEPVGPSIAYYETTSDDQVLVHASFPVGGDLPGGGVDVVDLPPIEAATLIHRGPMDTVDGSYQALARWIEANGYRTVELGREVYLDCPPDQADWVTELQIAVATS